MQKKKLCLGRQGNKGTHYVTGGACLVRDGKYDSIGDSKILADSVSFVYSLAQQMKDCQEYSQQGRIN